VSIKFSLEVKPVRKLIRMIVQWWTPRAPAPEQMTLARLVGRWLTTRAQSAPPAKALPRPSEFQHPPESRSMPVAELVARDMAMVHTWPILRQMNPNYMDHQAAMLEAWELGGRLYRLNECARERRAGPRG
jgi:hypothetical protein